MAIAVANSLARKVSLKHYAPIQLRVVLGHPSVNNVNIDRLLCLAVKLIHILV